MRIVIVTGMSGAGKTTALKMLEDMGFYCVDNLPIRLIEKFVELIKGGGTEANDIALGIDIRNPEFIGLMSEVITQLKQEEIDCKVLFLEASDECLIKRYKETRRSHPLSQGQRVEVGIAKERKLMAELLSKSDYVINTSQLLTRELKAQLEDMKAGGILSVNQGSDIPAYMIVLKHNGDGDNAYKAVIGKGLTFDSGGYNLKGNSYGMKYDMCGGADVLGIMKILAGIQAKTNVYGIIPVTENLVNGKAYKPQDVITTLSGKTVEVVSTDAEGRLILCDAITYAQRLGASHLIDLATLTGACVAALGDVYTGVFANDDAYYQEFEQAMKAADEKGWPLPMDDEYLEKLQSNSADFKNGPMTFGGEASGAACLLNEFVEDGNKWIHLDIAATAKTPDGATGAMIRSIVELLKP